MKRIHPKSSRRMACWTLIALLAAGIGVERTLAQPEKADRANAEAPRNPYPGRIRSPGFDGGVQWLNTAGPLELEALRGKVVLVDFWTHCCINCIHILPDLQKLEDEFAQELVVIGCHSAKFSAERDSDNIREAILRYEIEHPVVNDAAMRIWRRFGIRAWPTRLLIDPEGYVVRGYSGEGHFEEIRDDIRRLIEYHEAIGTLERSPMHFAIERANAEPTPLRYPGKLLADLEKGRLFIADSSHHRLVIADLRTGKVQRVIGTGAAGWRDGGYDEAKFNDPQGMALVEETLYVADRKNHRLRAVDLANETVRTLAGNGERGTYRQNAGKGEEIELASPWALLPVGKTLYIAMAGTHQIWKMDLTSEVVSIFAGSGRENITDGDLGSSAFAQPSGLAYDGKHLYVADSEVSGIRRIEPAAGEVETVIGEGLFHFGDADGPAKDALLQHALAIAYDAGVLYVADTYNNKIKTIDPNTGETTTFLGAKRGGSSDDPPLFQQPAGLSLANNQLYVADTNNHVIRIVDLSTKEVRTLPILGLEPPKVEDEDDVRIPSTVRDVDPVSLKYADRLKVVGGLTLAENEKLNPQAPMTYEVREFVGEQGKLIRRSRLRQEVDFEISMTALDLSEVDRLEVTVIYYPCEIGAEGVCRIASHTWRIPISIDPENGQDEIEVQADP